MFDRDFGKSNFLLNVRNILVVGQISIDHGMVPHDNQTAAATAASL
jgi:hypothetical protein